MLAGQRQAVWDQHGEENEQKQQSPVSASLYRVCSELRDLRREWPGNNCVLGLDWAGLPRSLFRHASIHTSTCSISALLSLATKCFTVAAGCERCLVGSGVRITRQMCACFSADFLCYRSRVALFGIGVLKKKRKKRKKEGRKEDRNVSAGREWQGRWNWTYRAKAPHLSTTHHGF